MSEQDHAPTETVPITVLWSPPLLRNVEAHAKRLGKTPSWVVEMAWRIADGNLHESNDSETIEIVAPQRLNLELDREILSEVEARASVEGCSVAWVLQRTLQYAWTEIDKLAP